MQIAYGIQVTQAEIQLELANFRCFSKRGVLTSSFLILTLSAPMWPAILRPGSTRLGVADIPMDPCCLLDLDP